MNQQRWNKIKRILDRALDLEPAKRGAFIRAACQPDEELHEQVRELLFAIRKADQQDFLQN